MTRSGGQEQLHDLVRRGDLEGIHRWGFEGRDLDGTDDQRRTPLHVAYASGPLGAAALLRSMGANTSRRDRGRRTPDELFRHLRQTPDYLLTVARLGALEQVTDFLGHHDNDGNTALHLAWVEGDADAAAELVAHGAAVDTPNRFGLVPTDMAMVAEYVASLRELAYLRTLPIADHAAMRGLPPNVLACALSRAVATERQPRMMLRCGIRLGVGETADVLVTALRTHGTKWIATDFLNSGSDVLEVAAKRWASEHGYEIVHQVSSDNARWGSHEGDAPPHLMV